MLQENMPQLGEEQHRQRAGRKWVELFVVFFSNTFVCFFKYFGFLFFNFSSIFKWRHLMTNFESNCKKSENAMHIKNLSKDLADEHDDSRSRIYLFSIMRAKKLLKKSSICSICRPLLLSDNKLEPQAFIIYFVT